MLPGLAQNMLLRESERECSRVTGAIFRPLSGPKRSKWQDRRIIRVWSFTMKKLFVVTVLLVLFPCANFVLAACNCPPGLVCCGSNLC